MWMAVLWYRGVTSAGEHGPGQKFPQRRKEDFARDEIKTDGQVYSTTVSTRPLTGPAQARFYAWRPDGGASGSTNFRICECGRGDLNGDQAVDALDLNLLIQILFFGEPIPAVYPACPTGANPDLNCDAAIDALDLNVMISYITFGGEMPCDPCACEPYPPGCGE